VLQAATACFSAFGPCLQYLCCELAVLQAVQLPYPGLCWHVIGLANTQLAALILRLQYLCCELAAQQAAGSLGSFRVHDVAHVAWRMKLATELETMIEQHKQVRCSNLHGLYGTWKVACLGLAAALLQQLLIHLA
jgi:hypothetical protein